MSRDRIDLDEAGTLDDVAIAATNFRMERMNTGHWWLRVDRPNGLPSLIVDLTTARQPAFEIRATWHEEEP